MAEGDKVMAPATKDFVELKADGCSQPFPRTLDSCTSPESNGQSAGGHFPEGRPKLKNLVGILPCKIQILK